jgi:hypothetical protein
MGMYKRIINQQSFLKIVTVVILTQNINYLFCQTYFINSSPDATLGNRALVHTNELKIGTSTLSSERTKNLLKFGDGNNVQIGEWEGNDKLSFKATSFNFSNGNVGIGSVNTASRLHIESPNGTMGLYINHVANIDYTWGMKINVNRDLTKSFIISNSISGNDVLYAMGNGQLYSQGYNNINGGGYYASNLGAYNYGFKAISINENAKAFSLTDPNNQEVFIVWGNGILNSKKIYAESFEVRPDAMTINWYDFVFYDNYNLMKLTELSEYIKINKHLPDIPTEAQIKSQGFELAEMNGLLLKKIEELTLYIIQQQIEIDEIKTQLQED